MTPIWAVLQILVLAFAPLISGEVTVCEIEAYCVSCDYRGEESLLDGTFTLEECSTMCMENETCTAFDYGKNNNAGRCMLNFDATRSYRNVGSYDSWIKHCGVKAVWGSFDDSTVKDKNREISNPATALHSVLRQSILQSGGLIADATPTLTSEYLLEIDVFFTSEVIRKITIPEQQALLDFALSGGVVILTPRHTVVEESAALSSIFGIDGFAYVGAAEPEIPEESHEIFAGITSLYLNPQLFFDYDEYVQPLLSNNDGVAYIAVVENIGQDCGAVLACAWDFFEDAEVRHAQNRQFIKNVVSWAHGKIGMIDPPESLVLLSQEDIVATCSADDFSMEV